VEIGKIFLSLPLLLEGDEEFRIFGGIGIIRTIRIFRTIR